MNKRLFFIIGVIAVAASIFMKIKSNDSHLTELKQYWWIPLPLALLCFVGAASKKKA